jgi:hypothetical protein
VQLFRRASTSGFLHLRCNIGMRKETLDGVLLHLELHFRHWKRTEQHILPVGNKKYKDSKKQILVREQENKFLKWHMDTGGKLVSTLSALQINY